MKSNKECFIRMVDPLATYYWTGVEWSPYRVEAKLFKQKHNAYNEILNKGLPYTVEVAIAKGEYG